MLKKSTLAKKSATAQAGKASRSKADSGAGATPTRQESSEYLLRPLLLVAAALPLVWAAQRPPLPAFFSQSWACALWGLTLATAALQVRNNRWRDSVATPITGLWGLLLTSAVGHAAAGWTPGFLIAPILLNLLLAVLIGLWMSAQRNAAALTQWMNWLLTGVLLAALINALVVLLQTVAPGWTNDVLVASLGTPTERPGGNLRQPNQLASLMVWGVVAATRLLWKQRVPWLAVCAALTAALWASGSRAGVLSLVALLPLAWIAWSRARADAETSKRSARQWALVLLCLALAALALGWAATHAFNRSTADASLAQRVALWQQTLALIREYPLTGVGWSQLNFAWTLTPFTDRAPDVFDHAHNVLLHLAVELGVPVTLGTLALLCAALLRPNAWRGALAGPERATVLSATALLATIGLHSLFEYPLWFSYFLLPSGFAMAVLARLLALRAAAADAAAPRRARTGGQPAWWLLAPALLGVTATLWGTREYGKAAAIHATDRRTLAHAVDVARSSPLYGQYGDYAAIMLAGDNATLDWFARPVRNVLDERLLVAWARALERAGDSERAAWISARARELPPDAIFDGLPTPTRPLRAASMPSDAHSLRAFR